MRLKIPLPKSFYKTLALNVSAQELINLYRINSTESQKDESYLLGTNELESFSNTLSNAPVWGMKFFQNLLYVCSGNNIYTFNQAGTRTLIGSIGSVTSNVIFEFNTGGAATSLVVLKPETGDLWNITPTGPVQIIDPNYLSSSSLSQSFGYFILPVSNSNQWQLSDQNAVTFSGLIATAESDPYPIVRAFQNQGETWLFKQRSTEIWDFNADVNFPYQRSTVLDRGCAAPLSVVNEDSHLYWLGDDKKIYVSLGYQYEAVSTEVIEQIIAQMATVSDAIFWVYTSGGQKFLTCQFPTAGVTYECNLLLKEWHKRESPGFTRWRANCYEKAWNGENYTGDFANGEIYKISFDNETEAGAIVNRSFVCPYFIDLDNPITFDRIELEIQSGLGTASGAGSQPVVFLSWTDDFGETFSNEYPSSMGAQGQYGKNAYWLSKGTGKKRALKFRINNPNKTRVSAIYANIQKGSA